MRIEYEEIDANSLNLVESLWEKLKKHQKVRSPNFAQHFADRTWEARRSELLVKAKNGALHVDLARDVEVRRVIAYCVSTVSSDRKGCVESIFVEPNFRKKGIGRNLMLEALGWMNSKQAEAIVLEVGVGNEAVLSFYSRYGFYPRTIILQQAK
jgi:ribosomal protein S18 acetylase RimI-like enzyme